MADLYTFTVPTTEESLAKFLQTIQSGMRARGIPEPNIQNNSHWRVLGQAYANELSPLGANCVISADAQNLSTAQGDDLIALARDEYWVELRPAAGSLGNVVLSSTASTTVITGAQLTDSTGLSYEVVTGGTYANGDEIPARATSLGFATNLAQGTSLQWRTAPAFSAPTALVGVGGLVNGTDAESLEALRQRALQKKQNPPGNGNPSHMMDIAYASSPSVQSAFIYPAIQGPGTVHVAVAAAPTATNASREIASARMTGTVDPYIQGNVPSGVAYIVVTTVEDVPVDCAICLSLPAAPTASPSGPGGGWLDGTPWPQVNLTSSFACGVSAVTSSTQFTVQSSASTNPTPGVSRISWFSYNELKTYSATVTSFTGSNPTWTITLDSPFTGIAVGDRIFPTSANQDVYIKAVLAAFELMGPGEKTTNASALIRGFRHPIPASGWQSSLGPDMLKAITDSASEVKSAQFSYRFDGASFITGPSGVLTPQVPASVTDAPKIFTPKHISFYQVP